MRFLITGGRDSDDVHLLTETLDRLDAEPPSTCLIHGSAKGAACLTGQWAQRSCLEEIDTNWSDPDGDDNHNYPDSILDFAFAAGSAKDWKPVCKVIVRDGDFPDDKTASDHRPIKLRLATK